jgi:secreted trypsin-like serine protease
VTNAGTIDPRVNDSRYVSYGSKFHFIAKICGKYKDSSKFCASAIAIHPNWIVTAAHVVENVESCEVEFDKKKFCISKVVANKSFDPNKVGYADIALGYSEDSFELDFYPDLYQNNDEIDKICSISGYGFTGTFLTGANRCDNIRRAGSNMISYIEKDLLVCNASSNNATELEFLIASGDSGGGLFIDGKLAGINSCVLAVDKKPDSSYTDESGHTRISKYFDWIMENINEKKK